MKWSFYQDVIRYANQGINGIGLWRTKVEDIGTAEAAEFLREMKMTVSSLSWCGGFTGSAGLSFRQAIDDAKSAIESAAELRAHCLIVYPGAKNGHTLRHAHRLLDEALLELLPCAESFGVNLAMEPMDFADGRPWTFLDGVDETLKIIQGYSSSNLGLVLDLFHVCNDLSLAKRVPSFVDHVQLIQVADRSSTSLLGSQRHLPGCGDFALKSWIRLLALSGFVGPIEAELYGSGVEHLGYECVLDSCQDFLRDCQEICRAARRQSRQTTE